MTANEATSIELPVSEFQILAVHNNLDQYFNIFWIDEDNVDWFFTVQNTGSSSIFLIEGYAKAYLQNLKGLCIAAAERITSENFNGIDTEVTCEVNKDGKNYNIRHTIPARGNPDTPEISYNTKTKTDAQALIVFCNQIDAIIEAL